MVGRPDQDKDNLFGFFWRSAKNAKASLLMISLRLMPWRRDIIAMPQDVVKHGERSGRQCLCQQLVKAHSQGTTLELSTQIHSPRFALEKPLVHKHTQFLLKAEGSSTSPLKFSAVAPAPSIGLAVAIGTSFEAC